MCCRITLVENLPLYMQYGANATFGTPLEKGWKDLLSMATKQVDVASFYWSLTGEDINVNTSTDLSVSVEMTSDNTLLSIHRIFQLFSSLPHYVVLLVFGDRARLYWSRLEIYHREMCLFEL